MRLRDPRHKVLIDARLRHGGGWANARIVNLSRRGLMVRTHQAPPRGSYIEICLGPHRILARVVWAGADRFGARSQDSLPLEALLQGKAPGSAAGIAPANDRRSRLRREPPDNAFERHRRWSRHLEFAAAAAVAGAAALLSFTAVRDSLSRPLAQIEARLGSPRPAR